MGILLIVIQRKYKSGNKWSTGAHWNAYLSISPGNLPDGNVQKEWHSAQVTGERRMLLCDNSQPLLIFYPFWVCLMAEPSTCSMFSEGINEDIKAHRNTKAFCCRKVTQKSDPLSLLKNKDKE